MTTSGSHFFFLEGVSLSFGFGVGVDLRVDLLGIVLVPGFLDGKRLESVSECGSSPTFDLDFGLSLADAIFDCGFVLCTGGRDEVALDTERENISGVVPVAEDEDWGGVWSCTIGGDMVFLDFEMDFDFEPKIWRGGI